MQPDIIRRLNDINRAFYATIADDFDATRQAPWAGWFPLLPHLTGVRRVLDVGCGNGRFGVFLREHLPTLTEYHGVDNNETLLDYARGSLQPHPPTPSPWEEGESDSGQTKSPLLGRRDLRVRLQVHDIIDSPLPPDLTGYDAIGLFGVIHHIPSNELRQTLIQDLAARLTPNGILMVAAWRFLDDPALRARVVPWPDDLAGAVESGDALLDWRRGKNALRYCHHCDDAEIDALINATGLTPESLYFADGSSGKLNVYSVARKPNG